MDKIKLGSVNFNEVVKKIAKENRIEVYDTKIKEQKDFTGDNFCSKTINVQVVEKGGESKQLNLFIKVSNTPEEYRKYFPAEKLFTREVFAYKIVLPELMKFRDDFGVNTKYSFIYPKYFDGDIKYLEEYLVLEDIMYSDFKMRNKEDMLEYKHVDIILQSLANYHAASFAMSELDPVKFKKLRQYVSTQFNFPENTSKMLQNLMSKITPHMKNETTRNAIIDFSNKSKELLDRSLDSTTTEPYNVIAHGDCWNNNVLFKNKGDDMEALFVDFQFIRYSSPTADLSYIFNISTSRSFRRQNIKQLCDVYYDALSENLQFYGCDVSKLYPKDVFDKHLLHVLPLGVTFGLITSTMAVLPRREGALEDMLKGDLSKFDLSPDNLKLGAIEELAEDIVENKRHLQLP